MGRHRSQERNAGKFTQASRVNLLEGDVDDLEEKIEKAFAEFRSELAASRKVLVGILISVTTAAIMIAINVIVSSS